MPFSQRFQDALIYANETHAQQVRKVTGIPYIIHLLAVAAIVGDYGGTEDQVIAALLHDAPEDQGGKLRLEDIRKRFGDTVARIVDGCSDTLDSPKPPWRQRKEDYIKRLQTEPAEVLLVSAADKLHNARTIVADIRRHGDAAFERFTGKKDGTLWYYQEILRVLETRASLPLIEELRRTIQEMQRLAGH